MPTRTIYVRDLSTWEMAADKAARDGRSMSEVVETALTNYVTEGLPPEALKAILLLVQNGFDRATATDLITKQRRERL
jgi:hypothetical protein